MSSNPTKRLDAGSNSCRRQFTIYRRFVVLCLFVGMLLILGYHRSSATRTLHSVSSPAAAARDDHRVAISSSSTSTSNPAQPPQAGSTQVSINFDELAPFTDVSEHYPYIRFSSPGLLVYCYPAAGARSAPKALTRGTAYNNFSNRHFGDLMIDFTQPVNSLKFYITEGDNFGTVAYLDYYQNGNLSQSNIPIGGPGPSHTPIPIDFQSSNTSNITRVKIHDVTDALGVSFDDFSFTVPAPTPTPTPTPTPPPAPTDLKGIPDENSARLTWSPTAGAVSYVVTRSGDNCTDDSTSSLAFQAVNPESTEGLVPSTVIPVDTTTIVDSHLCADHTYTYVVQTVGANGLVSGNSNSVSVTPTANGCSGTTITRPNGSSRVHVSKQGWSMDYSLSDRDGLVLYDIYLNGRRMAARFSVPYFRLEAYTEGQAPIGSRGELRPDGTSSNPGSLRSRLVAFEPPAGPEFPILSIKATYAIDHIPGAPRACLNITQQYQFFPEGYRYPSEWPGPCEPSEEAIDCAKFRPKVTYNFQSADSKEHLNQITIPQRQHYEVSALQVPMQNNTVGLFKDEDSLYEALGKGDGFTYRANPLEREKLYHAIVRGYGSELDNFHDTWRDTVAEPSLTFDGELLSPRTWHFIGAGCLECVHMHWRWAKYFPYEPFGAGYPLLFPKPGQGNYQSLDVATVRQHDGEEHPNDYTDLLQKEILSANQHPRPVVFWYVPTGYAPNDTFFWHTAWFNGKDPDQSGVNLPVTLPENLEASGDGPYTINLGDVFRTGSNHIDSYDLNSLGPLPAGYVALNNTGYKITTEAMASGPYTISFRAASINDSSAFQNLRIFHVEPDPFDPEKPMWVDRTVLTPDSPAPDFSNRTLSSLSEELGVFVIGNLIQTVPPSTDSADLSVSCNDSSDPIVAGNQLTYTVTVSNNGPQTAHDVAVRDVLPVRTAYVSSAPGQGTCKGIDSTLYCSLGTLNPGGSATINLVVTPLEGNEPPPSTARTITNSVSVRATEADPAPDNNLTDQDTLVSPNPNAPPTVTVNTPVSGSLIVGPTNISIAATASDSDGTISAVSFFDNGTLIGNGVLSGTNNYSISEPNVSYGQHTIVAVAIDNGGRTTAASVQVTVNGAANIVITSPGSGALLGPTASLGITAAASHPSGVISDVEVFANEQSLGRAVAQGNGQYNLDWQNVTEGLYKIVAVATDGSGMRTTSAPVQITVDSPPTVSITTPSNGRTFPSATNIGLSATAHSPNGSIAKVDFYANGAPITLANDVGTDNFTTTWRNVADGLYSLTAVATDNLGISTTSTAVTVGVNTPSTQPGEFVWFDDDVPTGATKHADGDGDWYWVDANPAAFSGSKAHQSKNFGQIDPGNGFHKHYFDGATGALPVSIGDKLFTYIFLDINNMPREVMLEWKDANNWEHRAYWGGNTIALGTDGTNSRRYMGTLPPAGTWARLEIPASLVGLQGTTVTGMSFALDGGRATFDLAGKVTADAAPRPTSPSGDTVWFDDQMPTGAVPDVTDDVWNWVQGPVYSGSAHQSYFRSNNVVKYRSHRFTGAQTSMQVNPGDVLFTYVYLGDPDPSHSNTFTPDQIMLEWYDGTSWNHRAYWGPNYIGQQVPNKGVQGTEAQRYMGGLPTIGKSGGCGIEGHPGWCRLEVPASYVGLEGKSVSGMAFSVFRDGKNPFVTWDRSGKSSKLTSIPLSLSAIASVSRLFSSTYGYSFETNEQGSPEHSTQKRDVFFVYPNQAAGTVPMYRFRKPTNYEYFYSRCRDCYPDWQFEGVAFYVYPDSSTPGTVPLYLYHDGNFHYFLTLDQTEATGMALTLDGISAYVYPLTPNVPLPPYLMPSGGVCASLNWISTSTGVTDFKIERRFDPELSWTQVATLPSNLNSYYYERCMSGIWPVHLRIRATNSVGDSSYSNEIEYRPCPKNSLCPDGGQFAPLTPNVPPDIRVTAPIDGDLVARDFVIATNAFDVQGNGTLSKVEFFANGNKLGEVAVAPYVLPWTDVPFGSYSLTAKVTDTAGATSTSTPVTVTVGKLAQTISFDSISDKTFGDYPFSPYATASSGLPVNFSIISGPATVSGNVVTITGTGTVTIRALQDGNADYTAAAMVERSFNVAKASATISLSNLSQTYDGSGKSVTATTNPAGLSGVSITYNSSATAPTNTGSYSIVASLTNDNYSASDAIGTLTIGKASQAITFNPLANRTYGDASFSVAASSSSGLPVSFSVTMGPATIASNSVTLTGAGTVMVSASQTGNENYSAATNVDRSFTVAKASATITLTNLHQNYDSTPKSVTATTAPSGLSGVSIKYNGSSTAPSNAGSYSVVASLMNDNYTATEATGTLIINAPPTVSIASPTNGALLHATSVTISASAADSDGSVSKVEFFQGSVKLGEVVSSPFSFIWNNVAGGNYSLTAVATDNSGSSTGSSPVSITVNNPPNISVTASSPQDVPTAPAQITINAEAGDPDGTISKVEIYQGTTLLATDVTSPYSYTWSSVAAGNYSISAKATDNLGGVTTSNVVGVSVNAKPNVSLASPANGASFFAPALVSLTATASDSDGSVSKVEFYQGSTLISTVTATPYSFNWSYVPAGTYTLTAKATDNNGASTTSNSVSITVTPSSVAIGKITFASNRDGCAQIYLMNTDGSSQTCLSNGAYNDESPKWSPDNSRIAFQSDRDFENDGDNPIYGMDIYVMNWDGSGVSRLTNSTYDDINPVWSPDGTKIAFMSFRNCLNYQIYVMNADGSGQVNISNNNANDTQPSWSPDGTKIAFASDRDQAGFSSIYIMSANGSNQTRVTLSGTGLLDEQPAWSPDGMKLAFITTRDSTVVTWDEWLQGQLVVKTKLLINKEVYVMNADGSSQIRLTNIMGNDDSPVWSPDGTRIAFRSDRDRNCCDPSEQIWMMNADGSNQVNLSNNQFGDHCPSWSR